jgi:hypothetical protein
MVRSSLVVVAALLWPAVTMAAGRSAGEVCSDAGFRPGTANFQMCVSQIEGDDPLAGLEDGLDDERVSANAKPAGMLDVPAVPEPGKPAVAPIKPPVRDGEFPASGSLSAGLPGGEAPPSAPPPSAPPPMAPPPSMPSGGGFVQPTPPTPPTPPDTFTVPSPAWTWGGQ